MTSECPASAAAVATLAYTQEYLGKGKVGKGKCIYIAHFM